MPRQGSTNVYLEDEGGEPIYDWAFVDRVADAILHAGCRPFVELGFMTRCLADPKHYDRPTDDGTRGTCRRTDWASLPRDYRRW